MSHLLPNLWPHHHKNTPQQWNIGHTSETQSGRKRNDVMIRDSAFPSLAVENVRRGLVEHYYLLLAFSEVNRNAMERVDESIRAVVPWISQFHPRVWDYIDYVSVICLLLTGELIKITAIRVYRGATDCRLQLRSSWVSSAAFLKEKTFWEMCLFASFGQKWADKTDRPVISVPNYSQGMVSLS